MRKRGSVSLRRGKRPKKKGKAGKDRLLKSELRKSEPAVPNKREEEATEEDDGTSESLEVSDSEEEKDDAYALLVDELGRRNARSEVVKSAETRSGGAPLESKDDDEIEEGAGSSTADDEETEQAVQEAASAEIATAVNLEHDLILHKMDQEASELMKKQKQDWSSAKPLGKKLRYQTTPGSETSSPPPDLVPFERIVQLGAPVRMATRFIELNGSDALSETSGAFLAALSKYRDVTWAVKSAAPERAELQKLYTLWALAHVWRAQARVRRHDALLRKSSGDDTVAGTSADFTEVTDADSKDSQRDQGYTPARLLVLLPFRNDAFVFVNNLCSLIVPQVETDEKSQVMNKKRFAEEFGPAEDDETAAQRRKKPADYWTTFTGNLDDDFMLGIQLGRKNVRLYSSFYASEVIVASPLGLRRFIEREEAESKQDSEESKRAASDFMSSLEMVIIDGIRVLSMQNWDHLKFVLDHSNEMPGKLRDSDFSRIRPYFLDDLMKHFRQTILVAEYLSPRIRALARANLNHLGQYLVRERHDRGTTEQVLRRTRQVFNVVPDVTSAAEAADRRFEFFKAEILPRLRESSSAGTLIFVSGYFDFIRLRNYFVSLRRESPSFRFAAISEYSKGGDITRARSRFYHAQVDHLIITERYHFFYRYHLRGANMLVFYSLPENDHYYPELVNMLEDPTHKTGSALALIDRYDQLVLERIVGEKRARLMTSPDAKPTFLLY